MTIFSLDRNFFAFNAPKRVESRCWQVY